MVRLFRVAFSNFRLLGWRGGSASIGLQVLVAVFVVGGLGVLAIAFDGFLLEVGAHLVDCINNHPGGHFAIQELLAPVEVVP